MQNSFLAVLKLLYGVKQPSSRNFHLFRGWGHLSQMLQKRHLKVFKKLWEASQSIPWTLKKHSTYSRKCLRTRRSDSRAISGGTMSSKSWVPNLSSWMPKIKWIYSNFEGTLEASILVVWSYCKYVSGSFWVKETPQNNFSALWVCKTAFWRF